MQIQDEYRTRFMVHFYADGLPFPSLEYIASDVDVFDGFIRIHFRWVPYNTVNVDESGRFAVKKSNNSMQTIKETIDGWKESGKKEIRIYHIDKMGHVQKEYRSFTGIVAPSVLLSEDCYFAGKHDNPDILELSMLIKFKKEAAG